jgi:hypothetical protein
MKAAICKPNLDFEEHVSSFYPA